MKETHAQRLMRLVSAWEDIYANLHNTNIGTAPDMTEDELWMVSGKERAYDTVIARTKELMPRPDFYVTLRDMFDLKYYVRSQWKNVNVEIGFADIGSRKWHEFTGMRVAYDTIGKDLR